MNLFPEILLQNSRKPYLLMIQLALFVPILQADGQFPASARAISRAASTLVAAYFL
jgi:hypothetical protein